MPNVNKPFQNLPNSMLRHIYQEFVPLTEYELADMLWNFYVYGLIKSNFMGAAMLASPVIGASILGGSALVGTAATALTNKSNQNFGAAESEKARQWSTNERLATQQYNTSEREAAQQYNTSERLATQSYNDPRNQMMLMRAAGANPSAMANGVSFVGAQPQHSQGASSSPGSSSTPSIGTAQVPNIPQLISSGSDLVNALAKNKETEASLPLINQQVEYYLKQTYGQQLTNDLMELEKTLKQSTLPASIKKLFEEVAKLQFEKVVAQNLGKKYENEAVLAKAQESLAKATEKLTVEQAIQAQFITSHQQQSFDSMLRLQNSQSASNYASANEANTRAELNKSEVKVNEFVAKIKQSESDFTWSMLHTELEGLKRDNLIKDEQLRAAEAAADIAKVNASHAEALFWKDFIGDIVQQGFDAFLGYRNMKSWSRLSSASQQDVARRVEEMKWKYGDSFTDTYKGKGADGKMHNYSVTRHSNSNKYSK